MLLRPLQLLSRPTCTALRPTSRAFIRPALVHHLPKRTTMASIQTPDVPADQTASAPNLQKDPETGEMVSKRCARLVLDGLDEPVLTLLSATASSRSASRPARTPRRRPTRCALVSPAPLPPPATSTLTPLSRSQAAAAPAQPTAKTSAADAEEELSPNVRPRSPSCSLVPR